MTETTTVTCDERHLWTVLDVQDKTIIVISTEDMIRNGVDRYRLPSQHGRWRRIVTAKEDQPEPVRCIEVQADEHVYLLSNGVYTHNTGGGKSVAQRNVIFHCIAHAAEIKFLGVDLKRVELSAYKPYSNAVIGIATTLEDAIEVLRFAQETMMNRYGEMEAAHHNNFLDMENAGSALMVMVDEAGELLDMSSPAKALVGSTPVPNLENRPDLAHLQLGDHIIGDDGEWHRVIDKYQPTTDKAYKVTIKRDHDGQKEDFTCGAQHAWTVYPHGANDEPLVVNTDQLMSIWESTPPSERKNIKFTRSRTGNALKEASID
jgi:hypothetical protein